MNGKTQSILLQVAFKGAVEMGVVNEEQVRANYELLINLHNTLGIDADDSGTTSRGTWSKSGGASRSTAPKPSGEVFLYNNVPVEDFRAAKAATGSTLKPNYPDFKTVNGIAIDGVTTDKGAAWLYDQDGEPNEAVKPLVAAADARVF